MDVPTRIYELEVEEGSVSSLTIPHEVLGSICCCPQVIFKVPIVFEKPSGSRTYMFVWDNVSDKVPEHPIEGPRPNSYGSDDSVEKTCRKKLLLGVLEDHSTKVTPNKVKSPINFTGNFFFLHLHFYIQLVQR